jgi:polyhydroxyalkanoate synthesis repressor PhaR
MRLIKKYSNRKLYDTTLARYINLTEIIELIGNGTELQVLDSQTSEDITNNILKSAIKYVNINNDNLISIIETHTNN